jgi:hypothetical protein
LITVGSVQPARSAICAPVNTSAASSTIGPVPPRKPTPVRRGAPLQLRPVSIGAPSEHAYDSAFSGGATALAVGDLPDCVLGDGGQQLRAGFAGDPVDHPARS